MILATTLGEAIGEVIARLMLAAILMVAGIVLLMIGLITLITVLIVKSHRKKVKHGKKETKIRKR